ncbi:phosphonate C-P lyase system protein PhnH [Stappia sp. F7233]|uniref:Phosphonate C-P lyase system protein PhnH n=1 Tax=Stappia albiluteola TaxID=2758565 RepID=A0A839AIV6_9HYPH|nr:phosphonate C-P lyase system protein PhnH [Stappia albiluteola]MBA5778958.1 phosphonate C-P lyase system protein PhnH [Stappia albiluteola]
MPAQVEPAFASSAPATGFADPVHDAQRAFRAIMTAMSRPGHRQDLDAGALRPPAPLTPVAAAVALTLFDYDTPVWLDQALADTTPVRRFLSFHTGCPITTDPSEAAFALISDPARMSSPADFAQGSLEYPDRSTTLIVMVGEISAGRQVSLSGPGLNAPVSIGIADIPSAIWPQLIANRAHFPCGVDLLFADRGGLAGLPRSTRISLERG